MRVERREKGSMCAQALNVESYICYISGRTPTRWPLLHFLRLCMNPAKDESGISKYLL
jgi:hypothetical protein